MKFNCCECNKEVEIPTFAPLNIVLKICSDCYNKKENKEDIPCIEEGEKNDRV